MKNTSINTYFRFTLIFPVLLIIIFSLSAVTQAQTNLGDGFRLAPGRVELVIPPGGEKTVVLNLQYNSTKNEAVPVRLMAYLNDWNLSQSGEVTFHKAGTLSGSASQWIIYSPAESVVQPGKPHTIRVTVSVPKDAAPGDHLAAVLIEPRSNNIKTAGSGPQFRFSFRLAALFYITVPNATRSGSLENLKAGISKDGLQIIPTIKNTGNSAIRPTYSVKIVSENNHTVFESKTIESPAVLGQSVQSRAISLQNDLAPGNYKVFYKVNFNDGNQTVEGSTKFTVSASSRVNLAQEKKP